MNEKKKKHTPERMREAVNSMKSNTDPLGSYTGVPTDTKCMPRKTVDGKIYMRVEDGMPVQDADDL